jgi:ATP-dependent DNA helicase RecG
MNQPDFCTSAAPKATLADLSTSSLEWFVERARTQRGFSFSGKADPGSYLKQLALYTKDGELMHAALLLFGKEPQRFCPQAVVKCAHYHGVVPTPTIPSQHTFDGTLFEQIEKAVDFVLARLDRSVGSRETGPSAPGRMEVPPRAISELIVNAVVHRDYNSNGSVQVTLFANRIEILNPGRLPDPLTAEDLFAQHVSLPVNPFLARPFYLAGFIEQVGRGTLQVIEACHEARLPKPTFQALDHQFQVTLWRDVFTDHLLVSLGASPRQRLAVNRVKEVGRISNSDYQSLAGVPRKTASRDLDDLVDKSILKRIGEKRGTYYVLGEGPGPRP